MKILLIGQNYQVGWELQRPLRPLGEVAAFDCPGIDMGKPEWLPAIVRQVKPRVIVNAATYPPVDQVESARDIANHVNGDSVGVLPREAVVIGAWMLHFPPSRCSAGLGPTRGRRPIRPTPPTHEVEARCVASSNSQRRDTSNCCPAPVGRTRSAATTSGGRTFSWRRVRRHLPPRRAEGDGVARNRGSGGSDL